jgi:hypothetical protein
MAANPFYRSPQWRGLVAKVWQRAHGFCEAPGCNSLGKVVDHIVSRRRNGPDTLDNLRLLCRRHDNQIKENEAGERKNGGLLAGCDSQGVPTDPAHPWHGGSDTPGLGGPDRRGSRIPTKFPRQFSGRSEWD